MKEKLKKKLVRRTQLILKSELNSKNRITVINMLVTPVITYSFNIIDWNLSEVKRLDVKIRKMMTTHSMHHPKADIHRLYLPRSNGGGGGKGLTQLKLSYKTSTINIFRYLNLSDDWMLQLDLKHKKEKGSYSDVREAREFACEIDLDLETEFDGGDEEHEKCLKIEKNCYGKGKEGYRYCLEVKTFTWSKPPSKPKS